jgi:DnaJ-class molecular chaperone
MTDVEPCTACRGTGRSPFGMLIDGLGFERWCPECHGSGRHADQIRYLQDLQKIKEIVDVIRPPTPTSH